MQIRRMVLVIAAFLLLTESSLNRSWATTESAWGANKLPSVGPNEMQALFGPSVFNASALENWSSKTDPTELGKNLEFNFPWFYYALPVCEQADSLGCIENVYYRYQNTVWKAAQLSDRVLPSRNGETFSAGRNASGVISNLEINEWPADDSLHLPAGGKAAYWKFSDAYHGGGNDYLVRVNVAGVRSAKSSWLDGKVQRYLEMNVFPFDGTTEFEFPQGLDIKIRLRLGVVAQELWGWFDGRINNPNIVLDNKTQSGIFEVSGSPSRIPIGLTPKRNLDEIGDEIKSVFACPAGLPENMCPSVSGLKRFSTEENSDVSKFTLFEKGLGKSSTVAYRTEWWIKSTRWPDVANPSSCPAVKSGFVGVVTTNASMYSPEAPTWNSAASAFEFQVASPHFGSDGKENLGYYSLILPRALAECRWGRGIEDARVVLSIIGNDDASTVLSATHVLTKDLLTFHISGFTYSAPTIRVGLELTSNPRKNGSIKSLSRILTLKCINANLKIKTFSGTNPKCPKGYKRKS